jgi:hypothetical protein
VITSVKNLDRQPCNIANVLTILVEPLSDHQQKLALGSRRKNMKNRKLAGELDLPLRQNPCEPRPFGTTVA